MKNQQPHAAYGIPGCYAQEIMTSHLKYTLPGGHIEEFVRKQNLNHKKRHGFQWISWILICGMHLMAVGGHCILSAIW